VVISQFGSKAHLLVDFFVVLETVIMQLVGFFMWVRAFNENAIKKCPIFLINVKITYIILIQVYYI
jgi:hypothetical protein